MTLRGLFAKLRDQARSDNRGDQRASLIREVKTALTFFVVTLCVVESTFGARLLFKRDSDAVTIVVASLMTFLILALVAAVLLLASRRLIAPGPHTATGDLGDTFLRERVEEEIPRLSEIASALPAELEQEKTHLVCVRDRLHSALAMENERPDDYVQSS